MRNVLLLLVLVAVVAAVIWYVRSRGQKPAPAPPKEPVDPLRREAAAGMDPRRIGVGDVIAYGGRDFIVRGTLELDEDGFRWQEHLLDDVEVRRWLAVEDDEELELTLYESVRAPGLEPGPHSLAHDGVTYALDEHGTARFRAVGTTGTGPSGRLEYYDYTSDDRRLAFERYGTGSWEVSTGQVVPAYALDIYPASSS